MPRKAKRGPKPAVPPKPGDPSSPTSPPTSPESPDPPAGAMATVSPIAMATASPITTTSSVSTTIAESCSSTVSTVTGEGTTTSTSVSQEKSSVTMETTTSSVTTAKKLSLCSDEDLDALVKMNLPEASGNISPVSPAKSFKTNLEPLSEDKDAEKTAEVSHKEVVLGSKMMIRTGVVSKKTSKVIKCSFNPESRDKPTSLTDVWEESEPTSPDVKADVHEVTSLPTATSLDDINISERLQEVLDTSERMLYDIPPTSPSSGKRGRKRFIRADSTDRRGSFFIKNTEDTDDPDAPLHSFEIGSAFYDDYEVDNATGEDSLNDIVVNVDVKDTKCDEPKDVITVAKDEPSARDARISKQLLVDTKPIEDEPIVDNKKSEIVAMEAMLAARALSDIEKQIEDAMEDTQKTDIVPEEVPKSPDQNVTYSGTGKKKKKRHKPAMGVEILSRESEGTPNSPETPTDKPLDPKVQTAEPGKQSTEATKPPDIVTQVEVTEIREDESPDVVADVAPKSPISPTSTALAVPPKPKGKKKRKKKGLALDISGEATDSDAPETPVDVVPTQVIEVTVGPQVVETLSSPVDPPLVDFADKALEESYEVVSNVASSPIDVSPQATNLFDDTKRDMKSTAKPSDSPKWVDSGYPTLSSPIEEAQPEASPTADISAVASTAAEPTEVVLTTKPKSKRKKKKKGGLSLDLGGTSDVTDSDAPDTPVHDSPKAIPKTDSKEEVVAKSSPVDESTFVFVDNVQEEPKVIDMDAIRAFVSDSVVDPALRQVAEDSKKAEQEPETLNSGQPELPKPSTLVVLTKPKGKKKKKKGGLSLRVDGEATDSDAPLTPSEERPKEVGIEVLTQSSPVVRPEFPESQPAEVVADVASSPVEVSPGATQIFFSKDEPRAKLQEQLSRWSETGYATLSSPLDEAQKEFPSEDTVEVKGGPTPSSPVSPEPATLRVPAKPKGKKRKKKKDGLMLNVSGEATDSDAPETPVGEDMLVIPDESPEVRVETTPDEQTSQEMPKSPISPLAAPASPKPKGKKKKKKRFPAVDTGGDATDSDAPEHPVEEQPAIESHEKVKVGDQTVTSDVLLPGISKAEVEDIIKSENLEEEPESLSIPKSPAAAPSSPKPKGKKKKKKVGHALELCGEATDSDAQETPVDEKSTIEDTDRTVVTLDRTPPSPNVVSEVPQETGEKSSVPKAPISPLAALAVSPKPKKKKKTGLTLHIGGDATDSDAPADDKHVVEPADATAEVRPRIVKPEPKDDLDSLLMSTAPISPLFAPSSPRPKGRKKKHKRPGKLGLDLSGDVTDSDAPDTPLEKLLNEFRTASTPVDSHTHTEFSTTQEHTVTDVASSPIEVAPDAAYIFFPKSMPIKENDPRGDLFLPKWLEVGCPTLSTPVDEAVKEFPPEEVQNDESQKHEEQCEQKTTDTEVEPHSMLKSPLPLSPTKLKGKKKRKKKVPGLALDLGGEATDSDALDTPTIETMVPTTEEAFDTQSSPVEAFFPQSMQQVEPSTTVVEVASSPVEVTPEAADIFTSKKSEKVEPKDDDSPKWIETGYATLSSPLDEARTEFPDETKVEAAAKPHDITKEPQTEELPNQIPAEAKPPAKKSKRKKTKKLGIALDVGTEATGSDAPLTPEPECTDGIQLQNKKPQAFYLDVETGEMSDYDSDTPATPLTPKAQKKLLQLQARHEKPADPAPSQPVSEIDIGTAEVPPSSIEAVTEPGDEKQEKPVSAKYEELAEPVKSPVTPPGVLITKGKGKKKRKKQPGLSIELGGEATDSDAPDTPVTSEHKPINEAVKTSSSPVDSCEPEFPTKDTETTVVEVASSPVEVSQDAASIFFSKPDSPKRAKTEDERWAMSGYPTLSSPLEEGAKDFPDEEVVKLTPDKPDNDVKEPVAVIQAEPKLPPSSPKTKRNKKKKKVGGLALDVDGNGTDSDAPATPLDEEKKVVKSEISDKTAPELIAEKAQTIVVQEALPDASAKEHISEPTTAEVSIPGPLSPRVKGKKKKKKKGRLTIDICGGETTDSDAPDTPVTEPKPVTDFAEDAIKTASSPVESSVPEFPVKDTETTVVEVASSPVEVSQEAASIFFAKPESPKKQVAEDEKWAESGYPTLSSPLEEGAKDFPDEGVTSLTPHAPAIDVKTPVAVIQAEPKLPPSSPKTKRNKKKKKIGNLALDVDRNAPDSDAPVTPLEDEKKVIKDNESDKVASELTAENLPATVVQEAAPHVSAKEQISEPVTAEVPIPSHLSPRVKGKKKKKKKGGLTLDIGDVEATDSDAPDTPVTEPKPVTDVDKETIKTTSSPVESSVPDFPVKDTETTVVEVASSPVEVSQEAASIFFAKPESPKKPKTYDEKWAESGYPTLSSPLEEAAKQFPDEDVMSLTPSAPSNDATTPVTVLQADPKLPPPSPKTKRNKKKKKKGEALSLDVEGNATDSDAPVTPLEEAKAETTQEQIHEEVSTKPKVERMIETEPEKPLQLEESPLASPVQVLEANKSPSSPKPEGKRKKKKGALTVDVSGDAGTDSDAPVTPLEANKKSVDPVEKEKTTSSPVDLAPTDPPACSEPVAVEVASSPVDVAVGAKEIFVNDHQQPRTTIKVSEDVPKWTETGYPTSSSPLEEATKEFPAEEIPDAVSSQAVQKFPATLNLNEQPVTPASPKPKGKKKKKKKGIVTLDVGGEATDSDAPVTPDPPTKTEGDERKKPHAFYLDVKTGEMSDYDSDAPATPLTPKAQKKLLQLQSRNEKPEEIPPSEKRLPVEDTKSAPDDTKVQRPVALEPIPKNATTKKPKAFVLDVKTGEISDYDSDAPEAPLTPGAQRKLMQLQARHNERKRNKSSEQGEVHESKTIEDINLAPAPPESIPVPTDTKTVQKKPQAFCIDITTGLVSDYDSDAETPLTPRAKKKFSKLQERHTHEKVTTPKLAETVDDKPVEEATAELDKQLPSPDVTRITSKKPQAFVLDVQTGHVSDYDSDAETPLTPRARKKLMKLQARHDAKERSPLSPKQKEPNEETPVEQKSEPEQLITNTPELKKPKKPEAFYLDVQTGQMSDYDSDAPTTPLTPKAKKKFLQLRARHEKKDAAETEPAEGSECIDQVQKAEKESFEKPPELVAEVTKDVPKSTVQKPEMVSKEPKKNNVDIVADFTSEQPKVVLIKKAKKKKKKKGLKLNVQDGEGSEYTDSDAPETPTTNESFKLPVTEVTDVTVAATETQQVAPQKGQEIQQKEQSSEKELHKMIADLTPEEMGLSATDSDVVQNGAVSKKLGNISVPEMTKKTAKTEVPIQTKGNVSAEIRPQKTDSISEMPKTEVALAAKDRPVVSESSIEPELPPPPDSWVTLPPPPPPPQEEITTPPPPPILHEEPKSRESIEHNLSVQGKVQMPSATKTQPEAIVREPQTTEGVTAPVPLEPKIWIKKNKKRKKKKLGLTLDLDAGSDYTDSDAPETPSTPDSRPITEPVSPPLAPTEEAAPMPPVPSTVNVADDQPLLPPPDAPKSPSKPAHSPKSPSKPAHSPKSPSKPAHSPKSRTPPPVPPHATSQEPATTAASPESKPPPVSPVRKTYARGPPPPPPVRVDSHHKPLSGQTQTSTVLPPEPKPITERPLSDAIVQTAGEMRMVTPTPAEHPTAAVEAEMGPVQMQMSPPEVKPLQMQMPPPEVKPVQMQMPPPEVKPKKEKKNKKPLPSIPSIVDESVGPVAPSVPVRKDVSAQKSPKKEEPEQVAGGDDIWQQLPVHEREQLQRRKSGHILECVDQPLETVIGAEVEPVMPAANVSQKSEFRPKSGEMFERVEQPLDTVIGVEVEKVEPKRKALQRPPENQVRERPKSGEILECLEQPFDTVIGAIVEQVKSAKTKVSQRPVEERERPKSKEILVDQPFDIVEVQQVKRPSKKEKQKSPTKIVPKRPEVLPFGDPVTVETDSPVWVKRQSPLEDPPLSPIGPMQEDHRRKSLGDPGRPSHDQLKPEAPEPRRHSEGGARLRTPSGKSTGSSKSGVTTSSEESSGQWEFPPFGPRASIPSRLAPPGAGDDSPIWVRRRVSEPSPPPKRSTSSSSEESRPRPVSAYLPGPEDSDTAMLVAQVTRVHSAKSPIGQSSTIVEVSPVSLVQSAQDAVVSPEKQQAQQALPAEDKKSRQSPPTPQAGAMPVQQRTQQTFPETSKKAKKSPKRPKGMVLDFSKGGAPTDTTDVLHVQTTLDLLSPCQDPMTTSDIKPDVSAPLAQHDDVTMEALTPVDQSRSLPGCMTSSITSSTEQKDDTREQIPSIFNKPADAKVVEKLTDETNTSKPGGPVIMRRKSESNVREPGVVRKRFQKRKRPRSLILADDLREFDFADADDKIEPIQREPEWAPNAGLPLEDARAVLEQCRFLLKRDDVLSVHIGWKWVNLKRTREMAIIIGVPRKIAQSELKNKRALPSQVKVKMVSHDENVVIVTDVLEDEQLQRLYTKPQPIRGS